MERNEPPRWIQDKHFNEVLFCEDFLSAHPMVCVDGSWQIDREETLRRRQQNHSRAAGLFRRKSREQSE